MSNNESVCITLDAPNRMRISIPPNGNGDTAARISIQSEQVPETLNPPELPPRCDPRARKREAEIKWREGQIEECVRTAGLAKEMGLGLQARSHTQLADLHGQAITILNAGYSLAETGAFALHRIDAEESKDPVPHDALTALQEAIDTGLFETYSVWSFRKHSVLVGSIKRSKWETSFEIARWNHVFYT